MLEYRFELDMRRYEELIILLLGPFVIFPCFEGPELLTRLQTHFVGLSRGRTNMDNVPRSVGYLFIYTDDLFCSG